LVFHTEERTQDEGVEKGVEEDIWALEGRGNRGLEIIAQ
jgi:hypothetical protein